MIPIPHFNAVLAGGVIVLIFGAYVKGCSDEKARFDDYKAVVKAVGQAQEARTKERIVKEKLNAVETDRDHKVVLENLRRDHNRELNRLRKSSAGASIVPPASTPAEGGDGDTICYSRSALASGMGAALGKLLDGTAGTLSRGEEARAKFRACATWALKNADLSR